MEMESIEFYKWEKQKALIIKYNTVDHIMRFILHIIFPFNK